MERQRPMATVDAPIATATADGNGSGNGPMATAVEKVSGGPSQLKRGASTRIDGMGDGPMATAMADGNGRRPMAMTTADGNGNGRWQSQLASGEWASGEWPAR